MSDVARPCRDARPGRSRAGGGIVAHTRTIDLGDARAGLPRPRRPGPRPQQTQEGGRKSGSGNAFLGSVSPMSARAAPRSRHGGSFPGSTATWALERRSRKRAAREAGGKWASNEAMLAEAPRNFVIRVCAGIELFARLRLIARLVVHGWRRGGRLGGARGERPDFQALDAARIGVEHLLRISPRFRNATGRRSDEPADRVDPFGRWRGEQVRSTRGGVFGQRFQLPSFA